jgi:hypothetical protein
VTGAAHGNRRIDRVLSADYLDRLAEVPLEELRRRRDEAAQEEVDLSYLRRLLQGRIDILNAEIAHRATDGKQSIIEALPRILADDDRPEARGLGRHLNVEPSRADAHRRHVEALVADVDLSDLSGQSEAELHRSLRVFEEEERTVSETRRAVQSVVDACAAELARRYRDGQADVTKLLSADATE